MIEENKIGRRRLIAGLGLGLTSIASVPAFGGVTNNMAYTSASFESHKKICEASLQRTISAMARTCWQNGTATRPWRKKLSWFRTIKRKKKRSLQEATPEWDGRLLLLTHVKEQM